MKASPPTAMDRAERLIDLLDLLREGGRVTVFEMSVRYGVSTRTILRDLEWIDTRKLALAQRKGEWWCPREQA